MSESPQQRYPGSMLRDEEKGAAMGAEQQGGIPGYGYGTQQIARSPLNLEDLDLLKQTVLFTEEDEEHLRMAGDVLEAQTGEILDLWYGYVGSHPHLIRYFADAGSDQPNAEYLGRVRERFEQWILDTCRRPYDQEWLDYHYEIALRHTHAKKNRAGENLSLDAAVGKRTWEDFLTDRVG